MSQPNLNRRRFAAATVAGLITTSAGGVLLAQDDKDKKPVEKKKEERFPEEAAFERDYDAPKFKPSWDKKQLNRQMVSDFVIYAHSDLKVVKMLLEREPNLINSTMDWGGGDWENALGGASHMGRQDIVKFLLANGARMDIFCATMMGMLDVVKAMITLEPKLVDVPGPHGFTLHWHAQVGLDNAKPVLDYLQSVKEIELKPLPRFLQKKKPPAADAKKD